MPADAWITLAVLVVTLAVLVTERLPIVLTMGGALGFLLVVDVIDQDVALSGLGSSAPVTIAALYVLAGAATATGALSPVIDRLLREGGGDRWRLARLCGATAALSTAVPNTPVVALVAPRVTTWARRTGRSPSPYLMPLSYAAVLGGVVTVIGTSTNLIVSDLLRARGDEPLGIFEISGIGISIAVVGLVLLVVLAPVLLRGRGSPHVDAGADAHYTAAMRVPADSALAGRTIEEAGLRHLDDVFVAGIQRAGDEAVRPATPEVVLRADDTLFFVGDVGRVVELHELEGLVSAEVDHLGGTGDVAGASLYEAVIAPRSDLVGSTLRRVGFRSRYSAAVLAIRRHDDQLPGKLGTVELRAGDVLLILGAEAFASQSRASGDFAVVAALDAPPPPRRARAWLVVVAVVAMVAASVSGLLDLMEASLAAATVMILGGVITPSEARRAINVNVVLTIAVSIGLGGAVEVSGLAAEIGSVLATAGDGLGDAGVVLVIVAATMLMTELLSNNAAAAVMFPVAITAAVESGLDPRGMAIAVLIGASCSFLSPIGYQTNLMVYSLGGYRFVDFTRMGAPLTLSTLVVTPLVLPWVTSL